MIINCIGIGADEEENQIDRDSEDWNQVQQDFWFVLRLYLLFQFWSFFSTSLSLIPKCLNDYKMI